MNDPLKVLRSNILNSKQTFIPKWWKYAYLTPKFITNGVPYGCSGPRSKREAAHTQKPLGLSTITLVLLSLKIKKKIIKAICALMSFRQSNSVFRKLTLFLF